MWKSKISFCESLTIAIHQVLTMKSQVPDQGQEEEVASLKAVEARSAAEAVVGMKVVVG